MWVKLAFGYVLKPSGPSTETLMSYQKCLQLVYSILPIAISFLMQAYSEFHKKLDLLFSIF